MRLATQANELMHKLKPKGSASVAFFESAYLLIYLTLRPLREQWNLVGTDRTTETIQRAQFWLLREVVCAVIGVTSDHSKQTDRQRDEVARLTTDHEGEYHIRQQTYDRSREPEHVLLKTFLEYIQTRIGRSFDDQELLVQLAA